MRKKTATALIALGFFLALGSVVIGIGRGVAGYIIIDILLMLLGIFLAVVGIVNLGTRRG